MELEPETLNALANALASLLSVLLSIAVVYGTRYVRNAMGEAEFDKAVKQLAFARKMADDIVRALEQTGVLKQLGADEKKAQAISRLKLILQSKGIYLDFDVLDDLIEASVQRMNVELKRYPDVELVVGELLGTENSVSETD